MWSHTSSVLRYLELSNFLAQPPTRLSAGCSIWRELAALPQPGSPSARQPAAARTSAVSWPRWGEDQKHGLFKVGQSPPLETGWVQSSWICPETCSYVGIYGVTNRSTNSSAHFKGIHALSLGCAGILPALPLHLWWAAFGTVSFWRTSRFEEQRVEGM